MLPKSPQPELAHPCPHPGGCSHEASEGGATSSPVAGADPDRPETGGAVLWDSLKRWVLWFLAFFGIYASSSVCPFCGAPGCPVGAGGAALVGGVFACLWQYGKSAWEKLRGFTEKGLR
jgi:hypothetical protein